MCWTLPMVSPGMKPESSKKRAASSCKEEGVIVSSMRNSHAILTHLAVTLIDVLQQCFGEAVSVNLLHPSALTRRPEEDSAHC